MRIVRQLSLALVALTLAANAFPSTARAQTRPIDDLKRELMVDIDGRRRFTQQMVDQIFSFGELGFQEIETSRYLTTVLRRNESSIPRSGGPTAVAVLVPSLESR